MWPLGVSEQMYNVTVMQLQCHLHQQSYLMNILYFKLVCGCIWLQFHEEQIEDFL